MSKTALANLNDEAAIKEIERKKSLIEEFVRRGLTTLEEVKQHLDQQIQDIRANGSSE